MDNNKHIIISNCYVNGQKRRKLRDNRLREVNDTLAEARGLSTAAKKPMRKAYRRMLIALSKTRYKDDMNSGIKISHNDIKKLERPKFGVVPVNIFDILEIVVRELAAEGRNKPPTINCKASEKDNAIISKYLVNNSIELVKRLMENIEMIQEEAAGDCPETQNLKYKEKAEYVLQRLEIFDKRHPGYFNSLFV